MQSWNQLEGKSVAGMYPLTRLSRTESDRAWFTTSYQATAATACIVSALQDEERLIANFEAACRVKHPNLLLIARVGRARVEGMPVVYAIMEAAEENLADVLRERPLDIEETAQITECLVAALGALHERGLSHGGVNPASVFATEETVKLRSDCIQKVTAGARDHAIAYAQDVGDLGALIFEALTQRQLTSPDEPAITTLPSPFRAIVQKAVMGRWGLTEITAALKKPNMEPRHPVPAVARPIAKTGLVKNRAMPGSSVYGRSPLLSVRRSTRFVVFLAVLASLVTAWVVYDGYERPPVAAAPRSSGAAVLAQVAPRVSTIKETSVGDLNGGSHEIWRVVVYTYAREIDAQTKVDLLQKLHPELKAEVFSVDGLSPFSVALGGPMDRNEAEFYRDRVLDAGLPVDSYTQDSAH